MWTVDSWVGAMAARKDATKAARRDEQKVDSTAALLAVMTAVLLVEPRDARMAV